METIARFDASEFDGCSPFTEGTTACTARSVEPTRFEYYEDRVKRWDKGEFSKQEAETIEIALKNAQEIKEINLKGTINVAAMKRIGGESESVEELANHMESAISVYLESLDIEMLATYFASVAKRNRKTS